MQTYKVNFVAPRIAGAIAPRGEAGFWANLGYECERADMPHYYLGHDTWELSAIRKALRQEKAAKE